MTRHQLRDGSARVVQPQSGRGQRRRRPVRWFLGKTIGALALVVAFTFGDLA